ncbi:MAG: carbon monoxide dehydrogenase subunit G [Candidatus Bathyarchaeia archaeon]|jgi:hypothetical protein
MIFEGTYQLNAPREKVWEFVTNPDKIGKCLPDLKTLEVESEDRFSAVIRVGVGLIKADFKFKIEITGKEPPNRVQLKAIGTGSRSSINIDLVIELKEISGGSELYYRSDVKISGMMVSLGQRVIDDTADKTVASIFETIKKQLG